MWHYIGEKYILYKDSDASEAYFNYWPSNLLGKFPMKGPKIILEKTKPISELLLHRTSLVYMIRGTNWNHENISLDEWTYANDEGPYLGGINEQSKVYSRIMLPGSHKMANQAFYLFGDAGNIFIVTITHDY